jgi:lipopolysaccharide/colanic/teichoic acid biosynthesis glycosyltransferase
MVLFSTAWVYERRRTYVFLHLPLGKRIDFRSYPNVRIFRFKYDRNSIIKSSLLRKIDGIIVDCSMDIPRHWQVFISNACIKGAKLYDRSEIIEQVDGYVPYENFVHIVGHWNLSLELYGYVKRLLDITASVFLVPFFVPIILVASFFIKVDSGGPVFFSQKRLGRYGKEFSIYKLRTMFHSENAVPVENAKHKDSRITKVGKVLRKYRIDELPQIFNVIKGDMSWIGPRPETVELSKKYTNEIPLYLYRNVVRPGISGWAAINQGYVGSVSETIHKLNYDLFYIKNLSFELDLLIAIRTIYVIASGFGSR